MAKSVLKLSLLKLKLKLVEADRILENARQEAAQEMARARDALRNEVAEIVVAGAEQILAREVDKSVHAQLLEQLKAKL